MKAIGEMDKLMEKEDSSIKMVMCMKATGATIRQKEKEYILI